jgi:hypothetical protein
VSESEREREIERERERERERDSGVFIINKYFSYSLIFLNRKEPTLVELILGVFP